MSRGDFVRGDYVGGGGDYVRGGFCPTPICDTTANTKFAAAAYKLLVTVVTLNTYTMAYRYVP